MSQFKTVFDFLKDVPKNLNHEEIYLDKVRENQVRREENPIDLASWEVSTFGMAESNILCGLVMPNKFTLSGMNEKIPIRVMALAKQKEDGNSKTSVKNAVTYKRSFMSDREIWFDSQKGIAKYPERPGVAVERDNQLRARIQSSMPNMSSHEMADIVVVKIGEALNMPTDMRHIFAKGYLTLMDYTLAAASKHNVRQIDTGFEIVAMNNITSNERHTLLAVSDLVVDVAEFTPSERSLLALMCAEYPTVKYAGDNVYTQIHMEKDDLTLVSERTVEVPAGFHYGSPDRMYFDMVNIACKMGCLHDMRVAFKEMRGLPFLVSKMATYGGEHVYPMKYPLSHNLRMAMGDRGSWTDFVKTSSNYFSTTKALVAEMLLGEALAYSIFSIGEELGAYGKVGCPTERHYDDPVFNSNSRDYGLKHEDEAINMLLQEWRVSKGCRMPIGFRGSIKTTVSAVAAQIHSKMIHVHDFCLPQVGFELAFSNCKHTTWAIVKGYNPGLARTLDRFDEVSVNMEAQAFKFMMGVRQEVPRVGYNSIGVRLNEVETLEEREFDLGAGGRYEIRKIEYGIGCAITPRTDEMELTAVDIHRTRYAGTRCSVVVDPEGREYVSAAPRELPDMKATHGYQDEGMRDDRTDNINIIKQGQTEHSIESADSHADIITPGGGSRKVRKDSLQGRTAVLDKMAETAKAKIAAMGISKGMNIYKRTKFDVDSGGKKIVDPGASGESRWLQTRVTEDILPGKYNVTRVPTSGEGLMCGLRAIGQDLVAHGMLGRHDLEHFVSANSSELGSAGNYQSTELAAMLNERGIGLTVLMPNATGSLRAVNYGTRNTDHNVVLINDNGAHYENVILRGDTTIDVAGSEEGTTTDVSVERLSSLRKWIGRQ